MPNEHAEVQQQTPRNTQNQHTHHQMSLHSSHASLMQGYGARSRGGGGGKGLQGSHLSENPYQKEAIDYYMSVSGKQSSRRGSQGLEYGVSFGYSDVGGQVPHQYRHAGNGPGSSVMSHYQLDYTASAATGGNSSSNSSKSGTGAFSPTHQYCLSQNPSVQSTPGHQMHPRQQGQDYSSHQPFPQRQQHRGYPLSGHRPLPQFSRVPLSNASAESARAYNFPPQRYLSGGATSNFECEISNSGSGNSKTGSNHGSVKPSNMAQFDSSRLSYSSSNYPAYDFHTSQSPHKQSVYSHRYTQNNLKPDYDSSNKIISSSLTSCSPYPKYPQASTASSNSHNSSMPQYVSQEIPKSVTQNQQPQVHPNFSPISNPSPAASGIQSPNCSSSPSPLLGASEGLGNSAVNPSELTSTTSIPNRRNSHNQILRAAPQLSPTPSSNSSVSSFGSSSGNVNTIGINASPSGSHSVLTQSQLGRGKICDENYSSLYPSSVDKLTRDPGINSLNALTSQVANIPNTVQHMLLSDSLISKNRGKDEPAYETGEHYQMLQNSHGLAANQEGSKTMSNSCSDSATRTVRMDMGGAQPDSGMNESTEVVKREGEENSSGGGDSMTRQTSGTSTESGYNHSSQNLAKQGLPLELVVGASKIKRQTLAFPRGNEHSIHSTSSSSPSSLPSSVEPSPNIPPPCTLSSFTSTSVSPSPTLKSPKEPIVRSIDRRNCNKLQENYDANGRKKKNQADQDITVTLEGSRSDMPRIGNDKLESHDKRKAEEAQKGSTTLSGKVEDCEKIVKTQNLDNPHKILKTGETQNTGGVGVIVSTRSEMTEHNTLLESPQGAPSAPQHLDNELQNSQNSTDKIHSSNAFKDARCVNGQGGGSICTLPSVNGTNIPPEPSYEQSPSCHHSGKQRSPYGYSELVGSMMDLKKAGSIETSTGKEANLRYESQHQPPLSYIPGQKKGMVPTGIMKLGRRGTIRDQDINPPVQQSSASILQEVLQGYHTEKTYDHTKNSVNVPDTHPQSQNMAHNLSRHSYGVSKSMMPRSLVPQTGLSQDHQASLPAAVPVKDYPLNLKQSSTTGIGQDPPPTSWAPVGMGRAHGESSGKSKMATSPNRPAAILPETTESSQQPPLKNINLADYLLPHRIPFTNPQTSSSAVQQLLLQDTEPIGGSDLPVKKPPMASSSSSSERCSVICDVSLQSTPEKEKDRHEDEVKETCKETGYTGASVIQQSHSTTLEGLQDNSKENKSEVKMETECSASKEVFSQNDNPTLYCGQLPEKKSAFRQQSRSPYTSVNTSTDNHSLSTGENRHINVSNVNPSHFHQAPRTLSSNLNLQASPSTRCQSNYPGIDGCGSHSGYGFENFRERSHFLSQIPPQHDIPSKFQFGNSQPNKKLQMYSHSHPHQYSQDTDDKREWEALHKNRISKDMMVSSSSGSSSQQYRSQAGMSSQASHSDPAGQPKLLHQQFSRQGSYYDMKIWNLSQSGREGGGTLECTQPVFQTNQTGVVTPGSDTSRGVTEKVKSFPSVPSSQKPSAHGSFAGSTVNLGTQQGRSPVKTERAGETNPLMMRRRVRSFISPIPAKRQHQDLPQQQRSTQTLYPSPLSNTASRHHDTGPSSPDVPHSGMAIPDANCNKLAQNMMLTSPSSQGKTNILPPRKGRGLKLEAIVQKITPNVKNNRSLTDFACTPLTGSSHTDLVHYNSDNQEQESCIGDSLSESVTGHGSSHSYLDEGLSLEEIMSYKGVEEIGPLAPTAYPCDLQQNPPIVKFGTSGNINRSAVEDLKQETHFSIEGHGPQFTEKDSSGEGKEELRLSTDFTLLGPLPPAPPLPCPVQASPPPSSSVLSDIQQFTNTYQQLETRRGEDSAESFLRKKLTDSGLGLGLDDYSSRDFYGPSSFHHNQHQRQCLLPRHPNSLQIHQQSPFGQTLSSMSNSSQLNELKPLETVVPKGYFPSGKKKGRPVGSVNKQKRAQVQSQNASINASPVISTPIQIPGPTATAETIPSTVTTTQISVPTSVTDTKESFEVPSNASQMLNMDIENKDVHPKVEFEQTDQGLCKEDDSQRAKLEEKQQKRRRRVGGLMGKEILQACAGTEEKCATGIFQDNRKSVFSPYIHVERKQEIGAVCTIVNEEQEKSKGEKKEGVKADNLLNLLSSEIKMDIDIEVVKEKTKMEQVDSSLLQSCTAGKTIPLSGYVLSGPVSTETGNSGQLLCCLCKKWANYKNLGDLYGPYYPPEYVASLPKNHPQIRNSLGTAKLGNKGADLGTCTTESTKQDTQQIEPQMLKPTLDTVYAGNEAEKQSTVTTTNATSTVDGGRVLENIDNVYNNMDLNQKSDPFPELTDIVSAVMKQELEQPQEQQNQDQLTEDTQPRPQHRKLTSHPRFKRRHRPGDDLPKTTQSNFKTSLPFQPPPQLLNQDPSEPLAHLAQLPEVPLDHNELWVHEGCIAWASGVFLVNGRLYGLQEALDGAMDTSCSYCEQVGAALGCYSKGCSLRCHYVCAIADCSLNEENFSLRCPKHKFSQKNAVEKGVLSEQSEMG
uniref:Transcription factor 20 n=1 Tax=Paramormyrops kingsleyae TaxID=1676925 RepID=A0A3B3RY29_9TELE|nr:transcription factor 20 [Paramormyrops kingsleyae]